MATRPKKETPEVLTDFEKRFVDTYFNFNFNGRLAYKALKPETTNESADALASKLLSSIKVKNFIEEKQAHIAIQEDIQLAWVVKELKSIVYDVKQEETERDPATNRLIAKPDRKSALAALAQLSRIAGFETKKVDVTTNGESINQITWNETKSYTPEKKTIDKDEKKIL